MMTETKPFSDYASRTVVECDAIIESAKKTLGKDLVILGHHYQREEVYRHADITGDSLGLSQKASETDAKWIVFCGVHFMAEVSNILTRPDQTTILPDLAAGCSMADMASLPHVRQAWKALGSVLDVEQEVTPLTYVNSAANLKAFCGQHGGVTCTSTNAQAVLEWAFSERKRVLFFPDQHLGRNTAYAMGIPLDEMAVWDFRQPNGGLTEEEIKKTRVFLWKGFCSVHDKFKPEQLEAYLKEHPEAQVIAHPEACFEVCQRADSVGSTAHIIRTIDASPDGSHWLVATELNLVNRLKARHAKRGVTVTFMSPNLSMCSTMFRTDPQHLAWVLDNLVQGQVVNAIEVPERIASDAKIALARMFSLSS